MGCGRETWLSVHFPQLLRPRIQKNDHDVVKNPCSSHREKGFNAAASSLFLSRVGVTSSWGTSRDRKSPFLIPGGLPGFV